jgi:hypothetical protein
MLEPQDNTAARTVAEAIVLFISDLQRCSPQIKTSKRFCIIWQFDGGSDPVTVIVADCLPLFTAHGEEQPETAGIDARTCSANRPTLIANRGIVAPDKKGQLRAQSTGAAVTKSSRWTSIIGLFVLSFGAAGPLSLSRMEEFGSERADISRER